MTYAVRFTPEAEDDLLRLYEFILEREGGNGDIADRALDAYATELNIFHGRPSIAARHIPATILTCVS